MNLQELDSYNLADAVKFNDKLNPRIWDGEKMRPEVRDKLLEIAADFKESLGLTDLEVKDITVSGSNAGYTYTPYSDIDLHLVVDIPKADEDEVYRELFDANELPDVYNGLMYFRYSREAMAFFDAARYIQENWTYVQPTLKKCFEENPSTDVLYGLTALMVGEETVTMPSMDFINFVHMKSGFNGWSDSRSWLDTVMSERDGDVIRINNLNQYSPVHYYDKTYATKELIKYYESRRTSSI